MMNDAMLRLVETISKYPGSRKTLVTLESLQNLLLETNGWMRTDNGPRWLIAHELVCPGVYKVWLKKEENDG